MELECDLSQINNEELLRKMWQQSKDVNRKQEIRSQLYKLRESRLKDLYQGDIMADYSAASFAKDPLLTSHGDALADQSFQSLKSKEIRDSLSPTEMRFQSMTLNNPSTSGWNVQTAKEVSPDGKGFRAETVATTDGVESVNGGMAEFKGRNEQRSSAHHEGDDKNFVKKAIESSNSHLQENVVLGDENSGRTEVRTSSTKSSSSSQVIQSSTNEEYDNGLPTQPQNYLVDTSRLSHLHQQQEQQRLLDEQRIYEQQFQQQQRQQHHNQQEHRTTGQVSTTRQNTEQKNISQNIQTQETHEQNKRYVDMDKASPEYQQHVQNLMQQPGEIISNTVEYPKPNVKMITTVKRLPDGTIVRNKRYETEELTPTTPSDHSTSTPYNQTQPRRDSQHQPSHRNDQPDSTPHARPSHDMVESSNTSRYIQDTHSDDIETKFSSTKKSSSKFSTETTSETIQEFDEHHPSSRLKSKTNDFSTHGFPSVRTDKPTQDYPSDRSHTKPNAAVVPRYTDDTDHITERRINTKDGEVIIVSSEKKHNFTTSTNSEHIVETEHVKHDDQPHQQILHNTTLDFSTQGFPSVREPSQQQPRNHPTEKKMQDFPLDKLPPGSRIISNQRLPHGEEVVVVNSQKSHTAKHSSNIERIIEHDVIRDDQTGNFSRIQPNRSPDYVESDKREPFYDQPVGILKMPSNDYPLASTPTRPAAGLPSSHKQHPSSPRKSPSQDYSTQGFPSVKSPSHSYSAKVDGTRPEPSRSTPTSKTPVRTSSPNKYKTSTTTVRETTERVIKKEKEVDSAHRAFAASLRSSSPLDHTDYHPRHTPRSSVSSTRTFRRDMREGSHDGTPSETSRVSTTTITRNTPPRTVGGKTVVTKTVTTKTGPGSNDSLNVSSPRATKSPSPGKLVSTTTTTTTRTLTSKDVPKVTDNQHTRITSNKNVTLFPINEPPLTSSITKIKFSDNHKQPPHKNTKYNNSQHNKKIIAAKTNLVDTASAGVEEVVEAPCVKKNYYKLGPSDQTKAHSLENPQIYEKSPTKKPSSQPAPSSRSSTPSSFNCRKPSKSVMTDDYDEDDDDKMNKTSTFSSPSSRSRTAQKIVPSKENNKPQIDDWQMPHQSDTDERRTVNRETTFEKTENEALQPGKPHYAQPNVEWIIVDEHDDHDDSDTDSFATEAVDARINIINSTKKLITQEKQIPLVTTQRKTKPTTVSKITITTNQFLTKPFKTETKPTDKSPSKKRPDDTQSRTKKPLNDTKTPGRTASQTLTQNVDKKPVAKGPKSTLPAYAAPLRKPITRSVTNEETQLRKTLKTSQILKEKTSKLLEAEKLKERKTKPQTSDKRKVKDESEVRQVKDNAIRQETHQTFEPENCSSSAILLQPDPNDDDDISFRKSEYIDNSQNNVPYEPQTLRNTEPLNKPQEADIFFTPQPDSPEFEKPQIPLSEPGTCKTYDTDKPKQKFSGVRKTASPGFQKLQSTFDENSAHFGKPHFTTEYEPLHNFPIEQEPEKLYTDRPQEHDTNFTHFPYEKPQATFEVTVKNLPNFELPYKTNVENNLILKRYQHEVGKMEIPENKPYGTPQQSSEKKPRTVYEDLNCEPFVTDDAEYPIENKNSGMTSKQTVAKHIQKFEINFLKNNTGQPQKETKAPAKETLIAASKKLPTTPVQPNKSRSTTAEPSDAEEFKQFENGTEKYVVPKKKPVSKISEEPKPPSSNSTQRVVSPTRNQNKPEELEGRRPQSPNKHVLPKQDQAGQMVTKTEQPPHRVKSPSRNQYKPAETISRRPQSPNKHVSPNREHTGRKSPKQASLKQPEEQPQDMGSKNLTSATAPARTQKTVEELYGRKSPSHNKQVSPQRYQNITNNDQTFISSFKTTKVVTENISQDFASESPNSIQVVKDQKINENIEPFNLGRQSPIRLKTWQSSPNKNQNSPEKRPHSPNKQVSSISIQKSDTPGEDETCRKTERNAEIVREKVARKFTVNADPEEDEPEKILKEPKQTAGTEEETTERSFKIVLKEPKYQKPLEKPSETKSQSPNKNITATWLQRKPVNNETFSTSITTKEIVKEHRNQEDNDETYNQIKKSPIKEGLNRTPQTPNKRTREFDEDEENPEIYLPLETGFGPNAMPKQRSQYTDKPADHEEYQMLIETSQDFETSNSHRVQAKTNNINMDVAEEILIVSEKSNNNLLEEPSDENPKVVLPKPIKPTEADGDEIYSETTGPRYPESSKPDQRPEHMSTEFEMTNDKEMFVHSSEILANTSEELIETEQRSIVPSSTSKGPKPKKSPTEDQQTAASNPKTLTAHDKTFQKSLRAADIVTKQNNHKPDNVEPMFTDEEDTASEMEDMLIEICENNYVITKNFSPGEGEQVKPEIPGTPVSSNETITDHNTLPEEHQEPQNKRPFETPLEPWLPNKSPTDFNEEFIESERELKETPDGAFITKTTEPCSPTATTYRKKGAGRSDTFEQRCRQILGMENYGDTQGSYAQQAIAEVEQEQFSATKEIKIKANDGDDTIFQIKIENCDEDEESFAINSVKKTVHKQIHNRKENVEEPVNEAPAKLSEEQKAEMKKMSLSKVAKDVKEPQTPIHATDLEQTINKTINSKPLKEVKKLSDQERATMPYTTNSPTNIFESTEECATKEFEYKITETTKERSKSPEKTRKPKKPCDKFKPQHDNSEYDDQTIKETTTTVHKKSPKAKHATTDQTKSFEHPEDYETGFEQQIMTETTTIHKKSPEIKKPLNPTAPDFSKPETEVKRKSSPLNTPRSSSPTKSTTSPRTLSPLKGTPAQDLAERKPSKDFQQPKLNQKSLQKPETNTTTIKDRLRSSSRKSKSPNKSDQVDGSDSSPEQSPTRYTERRRSSNISVTTEIIIEHNDSDSPPKKENLPTIVRKSQNSVYKDIISSTVLPEKLTRRMPVTERKESAPVHRVTSKDKDTKMARSCSENLIKLKALEQPTKTTDHHRRPNKCFATKTINLSATDRLIHSGDMENVIIDIQQAKSSREPSPDKIVPTPVPADMDTGKPRYPDVVQEPEDERPKRNPPQVKNIPIFEEENNSYVGCHITEINMENSQQSSTDGWNYAEQLFKNPVIEAPASLDDKPGDDESLLTVQEKVDKYQNKAMHANEEILYSAKKLEPYAPQKSPDLVRSISRHISSKQNQPHNLNEVIEAEHEEHEDGLINNRKIFKEFKVSQHEKTTETTSSKAAEKYQQFEEHTDDDEQLIPHTATHTTIIEQRRQKNILSRPSVFESSTKQPTTITTTKTQFKCSKPPVKDSEKLRPDNKSRFKPTSPVTNTNTTTAAKTQTLTTKLNETSHNYKHLSQRKNSDIDNEVFGSNNETGAKHIVFKQTKVYGNSEAASDSKTNDLKKLTTTSNKQKPEKHMPVHLTPLQNTDDFYSSADDNEMIVTLEDTQVVDEDFNINTAASKKIPLHRKQQQPAEHSSTNSSPTDDQPVVVKQKLHLVKLTDNNKQAIKSNTATSTTTSTTTSIKTYKPIKRADDIDETVLEATNKKSPTQTAKMSTTATDSVAAKRSLFELNNDSTKRTPLSSPIISGRRPSYMEHTKSSLEHTRKDSLEINKTNYARKPSQPEDEVNGFERNSMVKFDVPLGKRATTPKRTASVTEDINVEEIFDLEILDKLLETVQSYEIRRRLRAQIRLIKKNQKNEALSSSSITVETVQMARTVAKGQIEEPDNTSTTTRKSNTEDKTQDKHSGGHISTSKKEYIFEENYHPTTRRSPKPNRYPYEEEEKPTARSKTILQQRPLSPKDSKSVQYERNFIAEEQKHTELIKEPERNYKAEQEQEEIQEITHETVPSRKSASPKRKPQAANTSAERRNASPETHIKERSRSPHKKPAQSNHTTSSRSPDTKTSTSSRRKSSTSYEQQESVMSSSNQQATKRTTTKTKPEDKTPVWADRKNILRGSTTSTTSSQKPSSTVLDSRAGYTKTIKSTTTTKTSSQNMASNLTSSFRDEDCVTSSYGIGPTDEYGLPLFGIRALKKKKPLVAPSETTEEVTGFVVEEKYYSDNKTKPTLERKEFIYSTNPEELQKLKDQVAVSDTALKPAQLKELRQAPLIPRATNSAARSSPEDDFLDAATKYVRRGSVKEMSEKFIQKEPSASVTEKSNNYPKAGLILRTNSRKSSRDFENESASFESFRTTRVQQHTSSALVDSDDNQYEYEAEEVASRHSGRFINESESECDSIKTQREFKKVNSSSSMTATRSFLNSQGEEKVVTNVSECLERMRNADNVVEEGDTAEDQEARAMLNKFLGASVIMKGVESSLPATNRQSKIITTTTTTSSNLNDDNDGDNNAKHEVKSTRVTKTIKSGSSSTPVTNTTCDIEEIWDEEILKELLEQARTYEERRKIRSRLRELMADREEPKKSPKGEQNPVATAAAVAASVTKEEEESSASEYEEIIEEVTDYSEADSDIDDKQNAQVVISDKKLEKEKSPITIKAEEKSVTVATKPSGPLANQRQEQIEELKIKVTKTETVEEEQVVEAYEDKTDSSDQGESLKPMLCDKPQKPVKNMPRESVVQGNLPQTNSNKLKSSQENMYNKSKTTATAPISNPKNPIATVQTADRADSIQTSNNKILNSNRNSRSGSLGVSSIVVGSSGSSRQVDRLGVPPKEDSGTESGEDLRLIAAGLRDQLQIQNDSNIIEDVTCALSRLESSLKEGKDITIDTEKRKALLALVARLRTGLTSPEKLAEIAAAMSELDGNDGCYGETSSPEADAHRSNRTRFGKRKNRVNRHTVGVSREELADARRYMEDMLLMSNISQSTTPEANSMPNNTPPQWNPLEKNASTGAIIMPTTTAPVLSRPQQFVSEEKPPNTTYTYRSLLSNGKRRPLSGEFSVSFETSEPEEPKASAPVVKLGSLDDGSKASRFANKKHLMKRANTIDLAKTHKYQPEFDTDSDADDKDKAASLGLKRGVQVSVKKRVQNVVPLFEPKTENDRKFLAFINKQSDKPGLGWTSSRSVSNWTNKFGSIKNTFEGGLVGKPPQVPHHVTPNTKSQATSKLFSQSHNNNQNSNYISNQQIAVRLQQEAERQAEERRRKLEKEHLEYERRERDKVERQRQQRERLERERLEREYFERQRREQDQITAAQHAAILREQQQLAAAQQAVNSMHVPQPIPINEFKHAAQSVFRPIDSGSSPANSIYKPIPQLACNKNSWQPLSHVPDRSQAKLSISPAQYGLTRPDNSFITSPPPSARSPIALPWASKPTVDSSSFRSKAHRFEQRSKYDNINNAHPFIQRHNSLRTNSSNGNHIPADFRKRPSLPNTFDPYNVRQQMSTPQGSLAFLPPPQNISFTYSSLNPKTTYQSYPCLPLAVANNLNEMYHRPQEDSLTDPHCVPLVLTSTNPSYCPAPQAKPQLQQQQSIPSRLQRQFDLASPGESAPTSPSLYTVQQADCTDDDFESDNNLLEYHAVSRVMRKPQGQTAVTVGRRTGHVSDDELYGKNSRAAKNLLSTMKSLGSPQGITKPKKPPTNRSEATTSSRTCLSPDGRSYQAPIVEPLFPQMNTFDGNRMPIYSDGTTQKTSGAAYQQPTQHNQVGRYKSMENLNRSKAKTEPNYAQQQQQLNNLKSYASELHTSYVVTYPIEDLTDDEEFQRVNQQKIKPPNSLDVGRHRNISETSTGSSTTISMAFNQNLPSPNTSWTSNPIVQKAEEEHNSYQNKIAPSTATHTHNYKTEFEAVSSVASKNNGSDTKIPLSRPFHESNTQPPMPQNQKPICQPSKNYAPKPTDYAQQKSVKTITSTSSSMQEKKSLKKLFSIDQPVINPKHSNISQEMLIRLDEQRERIANDTSRRKSLGNTLDFQMEKQARYDAEGYKSSAPLDTPDIVKSSLPKDETQPILKKFGPPQRHHYMPNSYQNPSTKTSIMATSTTHSTQLQGNLQTSAKQTVLKNSQQIFNHVKPNVMETPATPQPDDDYIPRNIVFNNVHAFSSMSRRQEEESINVEQTRGVRPSQLSKSDSWNQIVMLQNQNTINTNAIKYHQSPTNELRRSKSGHTLALPKMFEAAMTKTDISEKQKTVSAYFSGQKSPIQSETAMDQQQEQQQTTRRTVINRIKTSEKVSAASRKSLGSNLPIVPGGLQRSATMPHIANVNLLDESNVEDAFEQLMMEQKQQKSTSSTTEKTETKAEDGAVVTTTTKVTTRTVTGSAAKPVTPFAKFKQLDKQNTQQSAKSPTTPTTTGGSSTASTTSGNQPIFKFTDPALNAKAATVKEQLLQWCQSKTQEYENIEITNFSTSWNNGLAFCALIHHFLPDAFDYSQLTPKNRRKNFDLAFTVADEKAGIAPLLDVEDMVVMQRPDWKCVFVYVQSIYRRFRNCQ